MSTPRRTQLKAALDRANRINVLLTVMNMHSIAVRAGINSTDVQCINLLSLDGPLTPSRLAETMGMSKGGAVTAMVDRLEKAGYVRRTRDPHDRRQVLIEIVDGEPFRRLAELFLPLRDTADSVLTEYTDEQLEFIVDFTVRNNDAIARLHESERPAST
ncbi:MAG: MarR family transcriptional regulator [Kutzneria sp.]|nr:MarR family transcriptional regulator [Kutzneria sp.]MBV9846963.1 MarR family transcriptional regulator [Kutzneria sp.]